LDLDCRIQYYNHENTISLIPANDGTGLPPQMTTGWIDDVIRRMDSSNPLQRTLLDFGMTQDFTPIVGHVDFQKGQATIINLAKVP
jgi:hypothetical protein